MAKLYITKALDGSYTIRAQRLAGKELAQHVSVAGVKREGLSTAVRGAMDKVSPRTKIKLTPEGTTGERRLP